MKLTPPHLYHSIYHRHLDTKAMSDTDSVYEQEVETDQETWLERVNIYLEERLKKANRDNALLKHMAMHYKARNLVCKAQIRSLKAKLKKAIRKQKKQKELDRLQILAEASLTRHDT